MKNFDISPKSSAFLLLKKFLTMDPKRRITSIAAIQDDYLQDPPKPLPDAFSCFDVDIPFPLRQNLPAKKLKNLAATASAALTALSQATQNKTFKLSNGATVGSTTQMQYVCKPITTMPVANKNKFC